MFSWFKPQQNVAPQTVAAVRITVLVIQSDAYDWPQILAAAVADPACPLRLPSGVTLDVVQSSWGDIEVGPVDNDSYMRGPLYDGLRERRIKCPVCVMKEWRDGKPLEPPAGDGPRRPRTIFPDMVLVRNEFATPSESHRAQLLGLIYADVPAVNSLQSILLCGDKPVVQGALHRAHARHPRAAGEPASFEMPLMPQSYFASRLSFFYGRAFPAVLKFGTAHAGYGKVRVKHHHDMDDMQTLLPMTKEGYCTAEPFIESDGDLRLQKIGAHHRCFHRQSTCGAWKTNTQSAVLREVPVTPEMVRWMETAAGMFDGAHNRLDILTVDVILQRAPGAEQMPLVLPGDDDVPPPELTRESMIVMEVNGTSSGLAPDTEEADNGHIARLLLERLAANFTQAPAQ
jgi:glutathione synthase/RimK-type ligase-like ATP-grasp enzyme